MLTKKYISLIIICLVFLISNTTHAMSVYFEKNIKNINVGDVFIINTYIDTKGSEINGIDGIIKIDGNIDILNMNTAGSVFDLWPNKPSINNQEISFVGGSTSNVFGKKNKVFSFVVKARDLGNVNISLKQADVFLSDGNGTSLAALGENYSFNIEKSENKIENELSDLILNDKTPPKDFDIELGREYSMYDGKYFISFSTTDEGSGVNRYEIRENNLPAIRTSNSYLLEDQSLKGFVEVKAIDNAGNVKISTLDLSKEVSVKKQNNIFIFVIIIIIILLVLIYKHLRFKINTKK